MAKRKKWRRLSSTEQILKDKSTGCTARIEKVGRRYVTFVVGCGGDIVDGHSTNVTRAKKKAAKEIVSYRRNYWAR